MANTQYYGFEYLRSLTGHPVEQPQRWPVATGYATALNVGDPIQVTTTGYAQLCAAATVGVQGVCVGIEPYYDGTKMVFGDYLPASTAYGTNYERESRILVVPAAGNLFRVVGDDTTYVTYATYLAIRGSNADHSINASGTKNWPMLDTSGVVTTTAQWRIQDMPLDVKVDYTSAYVPLTVSGNEVGTPPASPAAYAGAGG